MQLALLLALPLAAAAGRDRSVVPAQFGVHALPALEGEPPEPIAGVRLGAGVSLATRQERALAALLTLRQGLRDVAELWMEFMPYEAWERGDRSGGGLGDLWVGFKILGLAEGPWWPAVATRTALKTTTGPDEERRFTDAADVAVDVILGKRFAAGPLEAALWAKGGFYFWQQGGGAQDDAYDYGLTARLSRGAAAAALELRGYRGWQQGDKPAQLALSGQAPLGPVDLSVSLARGLNGDAPRWLARLLVLVPLPGLRL